MGTGSLSSWGERRGSTTRVPPRLDTSILSQVSEGVNRLAIHDGTHAAAVWQGGSLEKGYATTRRILRGGLGGTAPDQQHYAIGYAGGLRSVVGSIDYQYPATFGLGMLRVRARAFLRHERFYPGPPERWE